MVIYLRVDDRMGMYCDNPYEHGCGRKPAPIVCGTCARAVYEPVEEESTSGLCLRCLNGEPPNPTLGEVACR